MPELPEVHTTVCGLQLIINKQITSIKINTTKLRYFIPKNITYIVKNKKIKKIFRLAKYIIFELSGNKSLIFHLGMSGRIRLLKLNDYKTMKHDHVLIIINYEDIMIFNDSRRFGFLDIATTSKLIHKQYIIKLGLDPFNKKVNKDYLLNKYKNSIIPIKQSLLDQTIITGIGNIYANEILYDAKISPFMPVCNLNSHKIIKLIRSIRKILKQAISFKGTSIRDFVSTDGTLGNYQTKFKVYNKENKKISKYKIRRVIQCGRSTFYCPGIQKSKYNPSI